MPVARFLVGRLGALIATMLVASVVVFGGLYLAPGSPIGFLSGGRPLSPQVVAALNSEYGLDKPLPERYASWLWHLLHGNLGQSIVYQRPVASLLAPRAATTFELIAYASVLLVLFGVGGGLLSAVKGGRIDAAINVLSSLGLAVPSFVAAVILTALFAVDLDWFPVFGTGQGVLGGIWHLTLPAVALALATTAYVARITRSAARQELSSEHVDAARLRGIRGAALVRRHVARNALGPITTAVALTSASLIAGSVIIDQAFSLNGLGSYLVAAVNEHDYPVVQGITLVLVGAFVVLNTIVDLLYPIIDPRIRLLGGSS